MTDAVVAVMKGALMIEATIEGRALEVVVVAAKIEQAATTGMSAATSRIESIAAALETSARIAGASRDRFLDTAAHHLAHTQGLCQGAPVTRDLTQERWSKSHARLNTCTHTHI